MTKDKRRGWLADLKVGSKVAIKEYGYNFGWSRRVNYTIHEVVKITPTGRINLDNGCTFNADGYSMGNGWRFNICEITDDIINHIKRMNSIKKIRLLLKEISIENMSNEHITGMINILEDAKENYDERNK